VAGIGSAAVTKSAASRGAEKGLSSRKKPEEHASGAKAQNVSGEVNVRAKARTLQGASAQPASAGKGQ
jgi:hypothetical protein